MPPRWKPVVSEENELVYVDASEPQVDLTSYVTPLSGQAAPQAQGLSPPHGDELYSRTMTEGGVSTDWFMEWLHRDSNQTSLLLMLGVALSIAAGHEYIGAWLQAAIANPWQTLSGLAGIACIASAVYPWVLPLQEYVRAKRTKLETNVQGHTWGLSAGVPHKADPAARKGSAMQVDRVYVTMAIGVQMNKMLNMPEEMATMIKQLDILIEEMAGQLKNVESMRCRTDWLPDKHGDDKSIEHAEQSSSHNTRKPGPVGRGILSKFF